MIKNADFTFLYGGVPFETCFSLEEDRTERNIRTRTYRCGDVFVTNTQKNYVEFDACEWVNTFENRGKEKSGILSSIWDCCCRIGLEPEGKRIPSAWRPDVKTTTHVLAPQGSDLKGNEFGCNADRFRYQQYPSELLCGDVQRYSTVGGRSCDGQAPFFNIHKNGKGAIFAVGWTGQWKAEIERTETGVIFRSGLEDCEFYLEPGEKLRTTSVTVMRYSCDEIESQNKWRRLVRRYFSLIGQPGRQTEGVISCNLWGGMTTEECLRRLDILAEAKIRCDHIWMDAGWYGMGTSVSPDEFEGDWYEHTGDWRVNPYSHPDGLKEVSARVHETGKKFILWFEPERVRKTAPVFAEHPEYFLKKSDSDYSVLLNLGEEKAWTYGFETLSRIIGELNIDYYREDFNIEPLAFWRANDTEGRKGITEIRYITGLYRLWDELLKTFPSLMIDNCASGGRRIDIETLRRSVPLWHSDSQCSANAPAEVSQQQLVNYGMWMPYFGSGCGRLYDLYVARSNMYPCFSANHAFSQKTPFGDRPEQLEWLRKTIDEAREIRPYYEGDLYPLTRPSEEKDVWAAYQLNRPEKGDGLIMIFRREESPYETSRFLLRGLEKETAYTFTDKDSGESFTRTGEELAAGLAVTMEKPRMSKILMYRAAT